MKAPLWLNIWMCIINKKCSIVYTNDMLCFEMQYARALKEKGVEVKVIVFPDDTHGIEK